MDPADLTEGGNGGYKAVTPWPADAVAEIERLRAAQLAERQMIANTAREWSEHYPQSSDGRNTFILFAEWVERRDHEQTSRPEEA